MKKGSAHIVTLVQLLILCAMFSTAFLVSRGFFNDLLTAKQYGLEICALFGAVLLTLTLIAAALVLPPAQSRAAWIAGTVGCLFVLTSHSGFKSTWNNLKKKLRSFTRPIQALIVWKKAAHWYDFRANRAAMESYEESLPKYLSAKLLTESDQLNKPRLLAEDILNSPIKVESSATREIMNEMKKIVTQSSTEKTQRNNHRIHRGKNNKASVKLRVSTVLSVQPIGKKKRKPLCAAAHASSSDSLQTKIERRLCDKDKDLKEFDGQLYRPSKLYLQGSDTVKSFLSSNSCCF